MTPRVIFERRDGPDERRDVDAGYLTPAQRLTRIETSLRWQSVGIIILLGWHVITDPSFLAFLKDIRGLI
jgi:hypothetical protein